MNPSSVETVLISKIVVREQVRRHFEDSKLTQLAASLRQDGQLVPVTLRRDMGELILEDGERRVRAAKLLGWEVIDAIIHDGPLSVGQTIQRQLAVNGQRADVNPIEKAEAIHSIMSEKGWTATEAAEKLSMSSASLARTIPLLGLSQSIREKVAAGDIPASAAYALTQVEDAVQRELLANRVASGEMTRDQLSKLIKRPKRNAAVSGKRNAGAGAVQRKAVVMVPGGRSVTLAAPDLNLESAVLLLEDLLTRLKKARAQGLAWSTTLQLLRDTAKAT